MLRWLKLRAETKRTSKALYERIVAQSRLPQFYADSHVPDTVEGRFDMIVLHMFLVLERLKGEGAGAEPLAYALGDTFMADLDAQMREMGLGDMSVPKKMRLAAAGFLGRLEAYHAALASADDQDLEAALARNVYGGGEAPRGATNVLAGYMRRAHRLLAEQPLAGLAHGLVSFPALGEAARHG